MSQEINAILLEDALLGLDELAASCNVSREWVIEHVQRSVLLDEAGSDPALWKFDSRSLMRARKIVALERDFDSNPELAGLVADLIEEIEYLRASLDKSTFPRQ
ncbi:MAG: chaperone modulator CbpM [Nitrosomonas sp.]|nr:chaperone modulator CbpM [Nitrosomonas sp.]MDP1950544.1 chaperone modulator CbpM [Nitrosomonas sp.]